MEDLYSCAQEEYMDSIHLPDFLQARNNWEKTLYAPLKECVQLSLDADKKKNILYVGCGPKAPLFDTVDQQDISIANFFNEICLSDFSSRYLRECKENLQQRFFNKKINIEHKDITAGLSEFFFYLMSNIFENVIEKINLQYHLDFLNQHISYFIDNIFSGNKNASESNEKYHYAYSEMVATYTGIPTLVYCEKALKTYLDKQLICEDDFNRFKHLLLNIWQKYNDKVFEFHINDLSSRLEKQGVLIIATDIEKIYNDPLKESVTSFSEKNEFISNFFVNNSNSLTLKDKRFIEWDDTIRDCHINADMDYLNPHFHKVVLLTFSKN